jgi:monoterpene epsilon-lactone hydrolase
MPILSRLRLPRLARPALRAVVPVVAALLLATATLVAYVHQQGEEGSGRHLPARVLPVPTTVSPALQHAIAQLEWPDVAALSAAPRSAAEWQQLIAASAKVDLGFAAAVRQAFPDVDVAAGRIADVPVFTLTPRDMPPDNRGRLVLHLHGGAFVFGGGEAAIAEAVLMAHYTRMTVVSIDYRLAPAHPFPAALDDVVAVWRDVIKGRDPAAVGLGGSSAGGGLALSALLKLRALGLPLPGAVFCGTPWADLAFRGDSLETNELVDATISTRKGWLAGAAKLYLGAADPLDPLVSPVYGDFRGLPPTILLTGTRDLLLSDTVRVHRGLRRAGVEAELQVFEGLSHGDYVTLFGSPESREAWGEVSAFLAHWLARG